MPLCSSGAAAWPAGCPHLSLPRPGRRIRICAYCLDFSDHGGGGCAGARRLKLFPATGLGVGHLKALRDVLGREVEVWPVGGTGAHDMAQWLRAGAAGIGVGSALYRAGDAAGAVRERARVLRAAWSEARGAPSRS